MRARDVMSKAVITVKPDMTLSDAIAQMTGAGISGLPVVDAGGAVVGILSESDLLQRSELGTSNRRHGWLRWLLEPGSLAQDYVKANGRYVRELMTQPVHTVGPDVGVAEVSRLMQRHQIKRVPVVADGKLVGIITRADLMRALAGFVAPAYEDSLVTDREICQAIRSELGNQDWAPRASIDVEATDGVVDLRGSIFDERQREAIRVLVENVPGVKAVRDHMVWVDPYSMMVIGSPEDLARPQS